MVLTEKERVMLAVEFASAFMQSGRSFPSFRELAVLGLDFVEKMEIEVAKRGSIEVKGQVMNFKKIGQR